jgi:uncharacterized protein (TIGR02300 family)
VANPKWGTKRICQSCGTKFYDLMKSPIVCPSCGTEFDPEALLKSRRPRSAPKPEPAKAKKPKPVPAGAEDGEEVDDEFPADEADTAVGSGEDDDFIEDTGDLGEDDMSDVVVEEEEDET